MYFFKSLLAFGLAALGATSPVMNGTLEGRIVGGEYVEAYQAPFFCGIYEVDKYGDHKYAGGSSLIGEQTLLTAASVLKPQCNHVAYCGQTNLLRGPFAPIPIDTFIQHEGYRRIPSDHISNNIALAFFREPIQCGKRIRFIELQTDPLTKLGSNYRNYGFGMDDYPTGDPRENKPTYFLKQADNVILSQEECDTYFHEKLLYKKAPYGIICTSSKDPTSTQCQLDQGGPLVNTATERQVALSAYVSRFCDVTRPGVYLNVHAFITWILEHIQPNNHRVVLDKKKHHWV